MPSARYARRLGRSKVWRGEGWHFSRGPICCTRARILIGLPNDREQCPDLSTAM